MYLFHSRGLNLLLLIISVSILDIKMFAKATVILLLIAVPQGFGISSLSWWKVHAVFVVFSDTVYKYDVKCHAQ